MIRIIVLGDINLDIHTQRSTLPEPGDEFRETVTVEPGGAAATFARTASRLGVHTALIGALGDDWVGDMLARSLEEAGIHTVLRRATVPSGAVLTFHQDRERSMICSRGANDALTEDWIRGSLLDGSDHLHVSGYTLLSGTQSAAALKAFALAAERGMSVSVDPPPAGLIQRFGTAQFLNLLPDRAWLFPNLTEGQVLTQQNAPADIVENLCERFPIGALTLGNDGAIAWNQMERARHTLQSPVVGDTTGAGDVFAAAFVARFLQSRNLGESNAFACDQARAMLLQRNASRG